MEYVLTLCCCASDSRGSLRGLSIDCAANLAYAIACIFTHTPEKSAFGIWMFHREPLTLFRQTQTQEECPTFKSVQTLTTEI